MSIESKPEIKPDIKTLPTIKQVIAEFGLRGLKSLGQHFLVDMNITRKIASFAEIGPTDIVLEIGPGPGGLTRALLDSHAQKVIVIEKDLRFSFVLDQLKEVYGDRLQIIYADALKICWADLGIDKPVKVVANLPYNVGTQMLINWLMDREHYDMFVLMFQAEVVDRLRATANTKAYGRLAVLAQWLCEVQKCFDVSAAQFLPPPKVNSSVVKLVPKRALSIDQRDYKVMEELTRLAFGQRRKMLRQSLKGFSIKCDLEAVLARLNLKPTDRAEIVTVEQFIELKDILKEVARQNG